MSIQTIDCIVTIRAEDFGKLHDLVTATPDGVLEIGVIRGKKKSPAERQPPEEEAQNLRRFKQNTEAMNLNLNQELGVTFCSNPSPANATSQEECHYRF